MKSIWPLLSGWSDVWCIGRVSEIDIGRLVKISKRKGLKVNRDKSKVMVLGGEVRSVCEVSVHGR